MSRTLSVPSAALFYLAAIGFSVGVAPSTHGQSPDQVRLDVGSAWSDAGGRITSQKDRGDGTKVLHGVQVIVGPKNWLKEYAVYNGGALEQRTQFYPNGRDFRFQRREHNGGGYEVIYTAERNKVLAEKAIVDGGNDIGPIKIQEVICQGTVKADKRWDGTFLLPVQDGFQLRLMLHEFRKGELVKSTPFPVEKLGLPKEHTKADEWLWDFPEWPAAPHPASR